ncbi:ribokinase [Prosthecomicrobium sp. N25]|uniref:ribokinase n=1 Tax=Prosthecomicrobium sp. N25 TaxID=3129254 RepID=UPI00307864F8
MPKLVVVGSINMDLVVTAERFPGPGETIPGTGFARYAGGKGANQAVAAARAGAAVTFVGAVGDDPFGASLTQGLARDGIDVARIRVLPGTPTGTAVITVARAENTIVVVAGANGEIRPEDAAAVPLSPGDRVVAQLEVPLAAIRAAFEQARAAGAGTLLNAAPALEEARALLPLVDILVVNEHELGLLAGRAVDANRADEVADAAARLRATGCGTVVVTLGAAGAVAFGGGAERVEARGHRVAAVDTTGAGDCFVGALAAELARGEDLAAALRFANAAAAVSVGLPGAVPSMPTRAEVDAMLAGK